MNEGTRTLAQNLAGSDDGPWALFLDFDGTLVEIAERPDAVVVHPELGDALTGLRRSLGGALAIVTGRSINVIDGFIAPHTFDVAGLHGVEYRLSGQLFPCRIEDHPDLRQAIAALEQRFAEQPGVLIEDKGCSVALHWRLAPEAEDEATHVLDEMVAGLGNAYRLQLGKAVGEVLPARASKGRIIEHYLREPPYRGRRAIFAGDDLTDEHAFEAVNRLGGISIRVGAGPTQARYRVPTPAALRQLLGAWASDVGIRLDGLPLVA
ncbi:MAG TPA: trehalose-phosphatase [Beijerinckiaceae bacterium]|nr:trehalose-phosphatase [Beijerinckiaceae bacterium]